MAAFHKFHTHRGASRVRPEPIELTSASYTGDGLCLAFRRDPDEFAPAQWMGLDFDREEIQKLESFIARWKERHGS